MCIRDSGTRYSYIVWLDAETKLPMRVDLLDRDGETLEQFRVVSFNVGDKVSISRETLAKASLPTQLSVPEGGDKANFNWAPIWLPQGVSEVSSSQRRLPTFDGPVESRLYSEDVYKRQAWSPAMCHRAISLTLFRSRS